MSADWRDSPLLRSSSALTVAGALAYVALVFVRERPFKPADAINVALVMDGIFAAGRMLYRCAFDGSFQPGEELMLYLVIGALAILFVSGQALADQYRRT